MTDPACLRRQTFFKAEQKTQQASGSSAKVDFCQKVSEYLKTSAREHALLVDRYFVEKVYWGHNITESFYHLNHRRNCLQTDLDLI